VLERGITIARGLSVLVAVAKGGKITVATTKMKKETSEVVAANGGAIEVGSIEK
jgi:hypothetical protein